MLPAAAAGITDGLSRLLAAATGGPLDGFVLVPAGNVVQAQVAVDFDADVVRETTFSGSATFTDETLDPFQGITFVLDGVADPNQPTANVTGSTYMAPLGLSSVAPAATSFMSMIGRTTVNFSLINGHLGVDPPGSGNAYDIYVIDGVISLDLVTGAASGWADGWIEAEGNEVDWSAVVETTTGGWQVTIYGEGFEFTVP